MHPIQEIIEGEGAQLGEPKRVPRVPKKGPGGAQGGARWRGGLRQVDNTYLYVSRFFWLIFRIT